MRQSSKLGMDTLRETSRTARGCQGMITLNQIKTDRNEQTISQLLSLFVVTIKSNLPFDLRNSYLNIVIYYYTYMYICIHTTHMRTKVLPPSDKKYGYQVQTALDTVVHLLQSCFLFDNPLFHTKV